MHTISRRGLFWMFLGTLGVGLATQVGGVAKAAVVPVSAMRQAGVARGWTRLDVLQEELCRAVGQEAYDSWFPLMQLEGHHGSVLTFSVPLKFFRNWINQYYADELLTAAQSAYGPAVDRVEVVYKRSPLRIAA